MTAELLSKTWSLYSRFDSIYIDHNLICVHLSLIWEVKASGHNAGNICNNVLSIIQ